MFILVAFLWWFIGASSYLFCIKKEYGFVSLRDCIIGSVIGVLGPIASIMCLCIFYNILDTKIF